LLVESEHSISSSAAADVAMCSSTISLFVGTWNVGNGSFPNHPLHEFIPSNCYDCYVIGLQECPEQQCEQWLHEIQNHM
jgi:hypothetical protein